MNYLIPGDLTILAGLGEEDTAELAAYLGSEPDPEDEEACVIHGGRITEWLLMKFPELRESAIVLPDVVPVKP